ncbi:hypothetical protein BMW23_1088 [Bodo saltans virus]|uniref:Uncharacterized protein n=1 Tax=Bodo saltans virus TaxID=2024608 RepID=A0A2H4UW12_9VIRU|nr:hypothetical protein QJ851_gp1069 [Bodo saltans virus]ATZ81132.1 hypothetical protein BMW23_1088 [Bodo saltans virus]
MSNSVALTKIKKNDEIIQIDDDIVPISKKELMARLEGDELKFKACYEDCVKHAIELKATKEEINVYKDVLAKNANKFKELKTENEILKSDLSIYKTKSKTASKEIAPKKNQTKSADDFNKDVEKGYKEQQDNIDKIKKSIMEQYLLE